MNVNLWFARDNNNEIVSILESNNDNYYSCPICNSKVIPKALESSKITPHFAHVDVTKCNSESMLHWWFKHKFIESGDKFSINADKEFEFVCESFDTEVTYQLESGTYRPDLVIQTECGQEIVFEMANTNKKKVQDYIDKWMELDKIVVEVDIKALQNVNEVKVFNALYYNGKCFNFNKRDGGYYNTIGKLKEKMKASGKYDVELVKKLDWFWRELLVYIKENRRNGDYFFELFEGVTVDKNHFYIIQEIIKKHKCEYIYEEYEDYKNKQLKYYFREIASKYPDYTVNIRVASVNFYRGLKFHYNIEYNESNSTDGLYESAYSAVDKNELENSIKKDFLKLEGKRMNNWFELKFKNFTKDKIEASLYYINKKFIEDYKLNEQYKITFNEIFLYSDSIDFLFDIQYKNSEVTNLRFSVSNDDMSIKMIIHQLFEEISEKFKSKIKVLRNLGLIFEIIYKNLKIKYDNTEFYLSSYYRDIDDIRIEANSFSCYGWQTIFEYKIKNGKIIGSEILNISSFEDLKSDFAYLVKKQLNQTCCKNCKDYLNLSYREIKFYIDKNLELPKRCKLCIERRKKLRQRGINI